LVQWVRRRHRCRASHVAFGDALKGAGACELLLGCAGPVVAPTRGQHGDAAPEGTFRLAEPIHIEPQQNFRVELSFPQVVPGAGTEIAPRTLAGVRGPFRIWMVLDGYLIRDAA
jgi:hypothetical protein